VLRILPQLVQPIYFRLQDGRDFLGSSRSGIDLIDERADPGGDGIRFLSTTSLVATMPIAAGYCGSQDAVAALKAKEGMAG
jgi:hypothetical protein